MGVGRRKKAGPKKVKMPQVEFDLEAISEIRRRKKRSKQRRKKFSETGLRITPTS